MNARYVATFAVLLLAALTVWAQSESGEPPVVSPAEQQTAQGSEQPPDDSQSGGKEASPPLTSVDAGTAELPGRGGIFLEPGISLQETMQSQTTGDHGESTGPEGITRLFATMGAQRVSRSSVFNVGYVGGGVYHSHNTRENGQVHQLSLSDKFTWQRGELELLDNVSYSPEALFGAGPFGGVGSFETIIPGTFPGELNTQFFSPGQFGGFGFENRITNLSLLELQQMLSPRSTLTMTGSYGLLHFLDNGSISSHQVNFQLGYSHALDAHNTLALSAGGGGFRFTGFGHSFNTASILALYGHQSSRRWSFNLGAGPQMTRLGLAGTSSGNRLSWSAISSVQYRFAVTQIALRFERFINNGSGIALGAQSDFARFDINRPLARRWSGSVNLGYAHSAALQSALQPSSSTSSTLALTRNAKFNTWYAGLEVSHHLTANTGVFLNYQLDNRNLRESTCPALHCSQKNLRHQLGLGIRWVSQPWKID